MDTCIIADYARKCLQAFESGQTILRADFLEPKYSQVASLDFRSDYEQFRVWAKNLGVLAQGTASVDYRLRDVWDVRNRICSLLDALHTNISQCVELVKTTKGTVRPADVATTPDISSESASDDEEEFSTASQLRYLLENTSELVEKLVKISVAIRKSGLKARNLRADAWEDKDGLDTIELFEKSFHTILEKRYGLSDPLLSRICAAVCRQKHRLKYWRKHQEKLSFGDEFELTHQEQQLHVPSRPLFNTSRTQIETKRHGKTAQSHTTRLTRHTEATRYTKIDFDQRPFASGAPISTVSSTSYASKATIPKPPPSLMTTNLRNFQCPYCCILLPRETAESMAMWRNHVISDLYPFVCVEPSCTLTTMQFEKESEWFQHHKKYHAREWWCDGLDPPHEPQVFHDVEPFVNHIRVLHESEYSETQIQTLVQMSENSTEDPFQACPFCDASSQDINSHPQKWRSHIANHLIDLFVTFGLPQQDDLDDQISDKMTIPHERSTLRQLDGSEYDITTIISTPEIAVNKFEEKNMEDSDSNEYQWDFVPKVGLTGPDPVLDGFLAALNKSHVEASIFGTSAPSQKMRGEAMALVEHTEQLHTRTEQLQTQVDRELYNPLISRKASMQAMSNLMVEETQRRLSQWLGLPDPSTNYHAALEKRHPETGLWLSNDPRFEEWKSSTSSLMWLHGNAGCGKTVLSATLLENIIQCIAYQSNNVIGYFYFDFNDIKKQSSRMAVRSLLFQFALQQHDYLHILEQLYQKCGNGQQQPAEDVIRSLLRDAIASIENKFIVLDALDECIDREGFLTFLHELVNSKQQGLRVLATCRRERDIEEQLSSIANYNINIQSALMDEDIRAYVHDRLATDNKLKKWSPAVQEEIITVIMEKANGMFRWAYCQLESIRPCVKLSALRKALLSLPKTLDETYDRMLQGLESAGQLQDAVIALRWLCYSIRPLQLLELRDILAIGTGHEGGFFPEDRLPDPFDIMVVCSSLVSCNAIRSGEDVSASGLGYNDSENHGMEASRSTQVRLAHFSVQEYLLSDRCLLRSNFQTQTCHTIMAKGCLHYLLYLSEKAPLTKEIVDQHPLARYAAESWWQHAQKIESTLDRGILDLTSRLLTNGNAALLLWVQLYDIDRPRKIVDLSVTVNHVSPSLYYAASIGLPEVVWKVLQLKIDVNAQGGEYGNALQAASERGYETVVQILLAAGADINAQGGAYGNALQAASERGYETVVQMLLAARADVNAQGGAYGNALQAASYSGYEKVVQMLLAAGADVNAQGGAYGNALQAASERGYEAVVQMLLAAGADVNAQGGAYGNALQAASERGYEAVVQMLLAAGADVNAQGGAYGNALQAASERGYEAVVQMLLAAGADVNAQGGEYGKAPLAKIAAGQVKVV